MLTKQERDIAIAAARAYQPGYGFSYFCNADYETDSEIQAANIYEHEDAARAYV